MGVQTRHIQPHPLPNPPLEGEGTTRPEGPLNMMHYTRVGNGHFRNARVQAENQKLGGLFKQRVVFRQLFRVPDGQLVFHGWLRNLIFRQRLNKFSWISSR